MLVLLLVLSTPVFADLDYSSKKVEGGKQVILAGTIQSALGGDEWDASGQVTQMRHVGNDVYEFVASLPKGEYEYKVTIGGSWDENYGKNGKADGDNIKLVVPKDDTKVKFTFNYNTKDISYDYSAQKEVATNISTSERQENEDRLVVLPGTIQRALGGNEWDPEDKVTKMENLGNGVYQFVAEFPKGQYEYKVAIDGSWDENYGKDGARDGSNIPITVPADGTKVKFTFDYKDKDISHDVNIQGFYTITSLTNIFEQKGEDQNINLTNELQFDIISENVEFNSGFELGFDLDNNDYSVIDTSVEKDSVSFEDVDLTDLEVSWLSEIGSASFIANVGNYVKSYDYLQILDASTESDERDNTKNPEDIDNDNYGFKVASDKVIDFNVAFSKYKPDLFESSDIDKYFGYVNARKEFNKETELGSSITYYEQKGKLGEGDSAVTATVFGKFSPIADLIVKGEYGQVPAGNISDTKVTGAKKVGDNKWKFIFSPADFDVNVQDEVHLVGDMQDPTWKPANKTFSLQEQANGTWTATYDLSNYNPDPTAGDDSEVIEYKFIVDGDDWGDDFGIEGKETGNFRLVEESDEGLDTANIYMVETNYKFGDNGSKGEAYLGTKSIAEDAYLPFAKDELANEKTTGYVEYYLSGNYMLFDSFKVNWDRYYKTQKLDTDKKFNDKYKVGFDWWDRPIQGLEYIKGHYMQDPEEDIFEEDKQEVFIESESKSIPGLKYFKVNTTQYLKSEVSNYFVEAELDIPAEEIDYIKGNLVYASDSVSGFEDDTASKIWLEGKLHHLPVVEDYITHILVNYEMDDNKTDGNGIKDDSDYDDDDNDWENKLYAETKFKLPFLENWDGLTTRFENRQIENNKINYTPENLSKDEQYYVADEQLFIEWYSYLTFETGYKLPLDINTDFIVKYDLNRNQISEYEDDALKIEISKEFFETSTLTASYNKQDGDEGEDYTKVMVETVF